MIFSPLRVAFFLAGALVVAADLLVVRRLAGRDLRLRRLVLGGVAAANLVLAGYLFANHIGFPLHLDLMEGTVLDHVRRAVAGEAIYPEPTSAYVPLAYNPLYYVLSVPFCWILGAQLSTLRLVAILGTCVTAFVLFDAVRRRGGAWWGLLAAGLFAAAYRQMDAYLDTAHSDSWMVATALLGVHVLDRRRTAGGRLAGAALLAASFWFKQHGALFALGALVLLLRRDGVRKTWPAWALAAVLGPGLYLLAGPALFGPRFLYFTWTVPSRWSEPNVAAVLRVLGFLGGVYLCLALTAAGRALARLRRGELDLWSGTWAVALLTGAMGALDTGSSNNVFIPMGTWTILVGLLGLIEWTSRPALRERGIASLALFASFALLVYNPANVRVSPRADAAYADLVDLLRGLPGTVWAPALGQLPDGYVLYPGAHWVALDDLIRGPGREMEDRPEIRRLLAPALEPPGEAFILANQPLEFFPGMKMVRERYHLAEDLGDRFSVLRTLPARWDHGWPRYLYRHGPATSDVVTGPAG